MKLTTGARSSLRQLPSRWPKARFSPKGGRRKSGSCQRKRRRLTSEAKGAEQGIAVRVTGLGKYTGTVKGDDVDLGGAIHKNQRKQRGGCSVTHSAHLLGQHDDSRGEGGPAKARSSEELDEAREKGALADDLALNLELAVDRVHVASSLERSVPKALERSPGLEVSSLLHTPAAAARGSALARPLSMLIGAYRGCEKGEGQLRRFCSRRSQR